MAAAPTELPATLYDGVSARRHDLNIRIDAPDLVLVGEDGEARVAIGDLIALDHPGAPRFGRRDRPGWRLTPAAPLPPEWLADLPHATLYGGWIDRVGLVRAAIACLLISTVFIAIGVTAPNWLAPLVPESVEGKMGEAMFGDFGNIACVQPAGQAALDALAHELTLDDKPIRVQVLDVPVINAAALPGRRIVLFRGLLEQARTPDEVAGVLAHEMGHVRHRDAMRGVLRELGLGTLLTAFGGSPGSSANSLLALRYSRSVERAADVDSLRRLRAANISPLPTASFFARLQRSEEVFGRVGTAMSYVSSHPMSAERRQMFAAGTSAGARYQPALDRSRWTALRQICSGRSGPSLW